MDDEQLITDLIHEYASALDEGHFEHVAELFRHGSWNGLTGYDAVLGWLDTNVKLYDGRSRTAHVVTNLRVSLRGADLASARSYITVLHQTSDVSNICPIAINEYRDEFVRSVTGWRFHDRVIVRLLRSDVTAHLRGG